MLLTFYLYNKEVLYCNVMFVWSRNDAPFLKICFKWVIVYIIYIMVQHNNNIYIVYIYILIVDEVDK